MLTLVKLVGATAGLCLVWQWTTHHWWLGLLWAGWYCVKGFYEGWQENKATQTAKDWRPL